MSIGSTRALAVLRSCRTLDEYRYRILGMVHHDAEALKTATEPWGGDERVASLLDALNDQITLAWEAKR